MLKKITIIILAMVLAIGIAGCSSSGKTETTMGASVKSIRDATLGSEWLVKQIEITVGAELSLVISRLDNGDTVDGYFYIEKGDDIGFQISGNSLIYESQPIDVKKGTVTSDRFSFTATTAQGSAYTLLFKSNASTPEKAIKQTIFLEIIIPISSTIYEPAGTK